MVVEELLWPYAKVYLTAGRTFPRPAGGEKIAAAQSGQPVFTAFNRCRMSGSPNESKAPQASADPQLPPKALGAIRFGGMRSRLDAATVGCQTFGVSEDCDVVGDGGQIGW